MKPLFIEIKRAEGPLFINSQDLKVVEIETDSNNLCLITSTGSWEGVSLSQYAVDKLRKELRDRYNVVTVSRSGINIETNAHKNPIFFVKEDDRLVIVWPKALRQIRLGEGVITLEFDSTVVDIPTNFGVEELSKTIQTIQGMISVSDEEA